MEARAINKTAYNSTIDEFDRIIQELAKMNTKKSIKLADEIQNLKYCIINTSIDIEI